MEINVIDAKNLISNNKIVFLDVRTLEERNMNKIEESIHIDFYDDDFEEKIKLLDKSKKYVVYCRSGTRSFYVVKFMLDNGFYAKNLVGGLIEWY